MHLFPPGAIGLPQSVVGLRAQANQGIIATPPTATNGLLARKTRAIIPDEMASTMPTPATLFRMLSEFIVLLLGGLLILIALTRTVGLPAYPAALVILGVVLIYWGIRASMRPGLPADRWPTRIRAGSLVLVGLIVLGIRLLPLRYAALLLMIAGGVLIVRGIAGAVLLLRRP
jgi:hypothetical protein